MAGCARTLLVLAALLAGATAGAAQAEGASGPTSTLDGVYTSGQAVSGGRLFRRDCTMCHVASQFEDGELLRAWRGRSVGDLLEQLRTTMPYDAPGRLRPQQYADILAFLLEMNGYPAGAEALRAGAGLERIRIDGPPGSGR